jgi:hypothetical protein
VGGRIGEDVIGMGGEKEQQDDWEEYERERLSGCDGFGETWAERSGSNI